MVLLKLLNEKGFTLIEVLIVLSINLMIIVLIIPIHLNLMNEKTDDLFLSELAADIALVQSKNYNKRHIVELVFKENEYVIINRSTSKQIFKRIYPLNIKVEPRVFDHVAYQHNGTFKTPGRIRFYNEIDDYTFELIFPFGKGGFYLATIK